MPFILMEDFDSIRKYLSSMVDQASPAAWKLLEGLLGQPDIRHRSDRESWHSKEF